MVLEKTEGKEPTPILEILTPLSPEKNISSVSCFPKSILVEVLHLFGHLNRVSFASSDIKSNLHTQVAPSPVNGTRAIRNIETMGTNTLAAK